jgi:hypothetical protein
MDEQSRSNDTYSWSAQSYVGDSEAATLAGSGASKGKKGRAGKATETGRSGRGGAAYLMLYGIRRRVKVIPTIRNGRDGFLPASGASSGSSSHRLERHRLHTKSFNSM